MGQLRITLCVFALGAQFGCMCLSFIPQNKCSSNYYADSRYENYPFTSYVVRPKKTSPRGIRVDTSGADINLQYLDDQTAILEKCLNITINSCAVTVKIASDFTQEPSGQWFPCAVPGGKKCAGVNQYPNILVLPPNLRAFRHELIHLVTHKEHGDPVFSNCDGQ